MNMRHILMLFVFLLLASSVFALTVSVLSENHSIIKHEIVFNVSTFDEVNDKNKNWDFNIFGVSDRDITNAFYEEEVIQTINFPIFVPTTVVCATDRVHTDDLNFVAGNYFCWDKKVSNGTSNATIVYPCQSETVCTKTTYREEAGREDVKVWQPLGVVNKKKYVDYSSLVLPTKLFKKNTNTKIRLTFDVPLSRTLFGSNGTWAMNPTGWWNASWNYKRQITVTNNAGVILQDSNNAIKIRITTELGANALANCNDVRVVLGDVTELDRNIVGNCQSDANIFFTLPTSIAGSGTDNNYYLYYGNVSASVPTNALNIPIPSLDLNTVLLYNFDYNSFKDEGANKNDLNKTGTASGFSQIYNRGQAGYYFLGTNTNYLQNASSTNNNPSVFTVEFWVYITTQLTTGASYQIASTLIASSDRGWAIEYYNVGGTNKINWRTQGASSEDNLVVNTTLTPNQWYHIAGTFSPTTGKVLYLNGVSIGTTGATPNYATSASALTIGNDARNGYTQGLKGVVDGFRVRTGVFTNHFSQTDANGTLQPTTSLGAETANTPTITDANITFNIYEKNYSTNLLNVLADVNVNAYDRSANSPFIIDFNIANYAVIFSRRAQPSYDYNTIVVVADVNKTQTIYLTKIFTDTNLFAYNNFSNNIDLNYISDTNVVFDFNVNRPSGLNLITGLFKTYYLSFSSSDDTNCYGRIRNTFQCGYEVDDNRQLSYTTYANYGDSNSYRSNTIDDHSYLRWAYNQEPDDFNARASDVVLSNGNIWAETVLTNLKKDSNVFYNLSYFANYSGANNRNLIVYDCNSSTASPTTSPNCAIFTRSPATLPDPDGYQSIKTITNDLNQMVADKNVNLNVDGNHFIYFNCPNCTPALNWTLWSINENANVDRNRVFNSTTGVANLSPYAKTLDVHMHWVDRKAVNRFEWFIQGFDSNNLDYNSSVDSITIKTGLNIRPTIDLFTRPILFTWNKGTIDINVDVTDPNGDTIVCDFNIFNSVTQLRTVTLGTFSPINKMCSTTYNSVLYPDGNYLVSLRVRETETPELYYKDANWDNWGVDNTAPTTSFSGCSSGWHNTDQTITLSCADTNSGCLATTYRVDAGAWTNYTGTFNLTTDLNHQIDYNSTDNATNIETQKTSYCAVDKTAPTVASTTWQGFTIFGNFINGVGNIIGGIVNGAISGVDVALCEYTINGGGSWLSAVWNTDHCEKIGVTISNGVTYDANTSIKDNAGNTGYGTGTGQYVGDTVAPTTTDNASNSWNANNETVTLSPTDAGSAVKNTYYCVDTIGSCTPTTSGTSVSVTCGSGNVCSQYVRYFSGDNVDNNEAPHNSVLTRIDKQIPTTSFSGCSSGWHNTDQTITLSCNDGTGSGCNEIKYSIDGGATNTYSGTFDLTTDSNHKVDYNSIDAVSNQETTKTSYCAVDKTAPTFVSIDGNGILKTLPFNVNVNGLNFNLSGKSTAQYRIDAGAWTNFTTDYNVPITVDGNYLIDFNFTDNANNSLLINDIDANLSIVVGQPPTVTLEENNSGKTFYKDLNNVTVIFTLKDVDTAPLFIDLYYSTTNNVASGSAILLSESTNGANLICDSATFVTDTNCQYIWNISLIPDGNYYLSTIASDGLLDANDVTNATLEIVTRTVPVTTTYTQRYIAPESTARDSNIYRSPTSLFGLTESEKQTSILSTIETNIFYFALLLTVILALIGLYLWKRKY